MDAIRLEGLCLMSNLLTCTDLTKNKQILNKFFSSVLCLKKDLR